MVETALRAAVEAPPFDESPIDRVGIIGFAESWSDTNWSKRSEFWGMNALHRVAGDRPFTRWFQLHDIEKHHADDEGHMAFLAQAPFPVYLWPEHVDQWLDRIPTAVPFPKEEVLKEFPRGYFTNTVSWLIALAILEGHFNYIDIFGVHMAVHNPTLHGGDEYSHQRPSCEYLIGLAEGRGIEVFIPATSDLLKSPHLYGAEDGPWFTQKMNARLKDLRERKNGIDQQAAQLQAQSNQLLGAIDDTTYYIRIGTLPDGRDT